MSFFQGYPCFGKWLPLGLIHFEALGNGSGSGGSGIGGRLA